MKGKAGRIIALARRALAPRVLQYIRGVRCYRGICPDNMEGIAMSMRILCVSFAMLWCSSAWAHQLLQVNNQPLNAANAIEIDDPAVSQVAYHVASDAAPELWLRFQGTAGQTVHIETGVPLIERLRPLRPLTLLIGPGLPDGVWPVELPEGMGALTLTAANPEAPEAIDEPFTGTRSWQIGSWDPVLPQTGQYYVVTFLPLGGEGKFWTAVGTAEAFGISDILNLPGTIVEVRRFHEVFPWGGLLGWGLTVLVALIAAFFGGWFD
jgi:hypothetical protein